MILDVLCTVHKMSKSVLSGLKSQGEAKNFQTK